jgi:hypothetical protein
MLIALAGAPADAGFRIRKVLRAFAAWAEANLLPS